MNNPKDMGTPLSDDDLVDWIPLSDPDIGRQEMEQVIGVLRSQCLSAGPRVDDFEAVFAEYVGRRYAVATSSGTLGLWLALRATGIGRGDEVIAAAHGWHQCANAIALNEATPVFADIDYWSGCLSPEKAAQKITPATRAIVANNCNGHPAAWTALRALADEHGIALIEDSTEAIGSRYAGRRVGSFGDLSVFDFSQPGALVCGEGGMVLTDDPDLATELRYLRSHALSDRRSVSVGSRVPLQACMSDLSAALGLAQLERIEDILARRKQVEQHYRAQVQTFEGIKPPYIADDVDEVCWMLYVVHLGKRFTASARDQLIDDLETNAVEVAAYSRPLHQQFFYSQFGYRRGQLPDTERIGDRALALPFHGGLDGDQVKFVVKTLKEAATNVGAGIPIY